MRRRRILIGLLAIGLLALGFVVTRHGRLSFPFDGPASAAQAGEEVTIHGPEGDCGPLVVALYRPSVFGLWNQTHSGNIFAGFGADERPWWSLRSQTFGTPMPCSIGGGSTFTLPEDLDPGVIAACDSGRRCARITVDR